MKLDTLGMNLWKSKPKNLRNNKVKKERRKKICNDMNEK